MARMGVFYCCGTLISLYLKLQWYPGLFSIIKAEVCRNFLMQEAEVDSAES
jgi:hypothetical protein